MSSYVHGCLLSPPLSLFHSSTWWWQRAQRREPPQEERRGEETLPVPLACQSNSELLNFTLNWRCSSPCQSLRDFRRSTRAKEHNEWKAPSQIDFKLNQTLVFNYLSVQPPRNFKVAEKERKRTRGEKVRRGKEGGRRRMQMTLSLHGVRTGGPVVALGLMNELLKWSPLLPPASGSSNSA